MVLGGSGILQNSQCALNAAASSSSGSGNNLTLNVALSFKPVFAGLKIVYMLAYDNSGQNTGSDAAPGGHPDLSSVHKCGFRAEGKGIPG